MPKLLFLLPRNSTNLEIEGVNNVLMVSKIDANGTIISSGPQCAHSNILACIQVYSCVKTAIGIQDVRTNTALVR